MDYAELFYQRLSELRTNLGVSARDMSLSLGQSESYINKIENRKALPSMQAFFYICDYLHIHPRDFFDEEYLNPAKTDELVKKFNSLSTRQQEHLLALIDDIFGEIRVLVVFDAMLIAKILLLVRHLQLVGGDEMESRVEVRHSDDERMHCPPVLQVSDHGDGEILQLPLCLADGIEVQHRLGWVLIGAVARIDDGDVGNFRRSC